MKSIFPKEILDYTSELYRYNFLKRSQAIYVILLISLVMISAALPFIKIDLYTRSPGMIRPSKERNLITSPINGKINDVLIVENSSVKEGDTLVILDDSSISKELALIEEQTDTLELYIEDLKIMCQYNMILPDSLGSTLGKSQFQQYDQKLKDLQEKWQRHLSTFKRQNHLYKKGVIAKIEFETSAYELEKSRNDLLYFKKHQKNLWQNELHKKQSDLRLVQSKLLSLKKNKDLHYILSPSTGNIQELKGFQKNNFLYTGSAIAEISPQTDLMVECYISPSDIGQIKNNQPVKFQIDAFDHTRWGSATGQIVRINQDISNINDLPRFKVLCSINETGLFLNKRITGNFQKGMTLTALFFIENRSLSQLLFDKLDDWYDPS